MAELIIATEGCSINKLVSILTNCSAAGVLYDEWSAFARNLQVPEDVIRKLRAGLLVNLTFSDVLTALLENWKSRRGCSATLDSLITVLQECRMSDYEDRLREEFKIWKRKSARLQNFVRGPAVISPFLEGQGKILLLETLDGGVTIEKVRDALGASPQLLVTTEKEILSADFQARKNISSLQCCILTCTSSLTEIIPKLIGIQQPKIILVIEQGVMDYIQVVLTRFHGVSLSRDEQVWSDLNHHLQMEILNRPFCGDMTLAELTKLSNLPPESILTEQMLVDLINNKVPNPFQHLLPSKIEYYIERKISPRSILSRTIFEGNTSGVFVFTGIQRHELSSLLINQPTDTSRNQIKQSRISVKYILLDTKPHFEIICSKTEQPVHWIHAKEGRLIWIKSRGGIYGVQSSATTNSDVVYSEDELLLHLHSAQLVDNCTTPVCISDSPGMGKSVLLGELARKLCIKSPNRIIIFIVVDELITSLKNHLNGRKLDQTALENALAERACDQKWLVSLLHHALENSTPIELMLDGFDELHFDDLDLAYDCLNLVRESYKSVRLWVATRPHLLHALENSLGVLGNNLVPFDLDDQRRFFVRYWSLGRGPANNEKLTEFSTHCLATLKTNMSSREDDIAGIPLQCYLIAEIYKNEAVDYSTIENLTSDNTNLPTYEVNSITDLYQRMIEVKFNKFSSNYSKRPLDFERLSHLHVYLGLWLVFPPWAKLFRRRLRIPNDVSLQEVFNAGILESKSTVQAPRFLHRTFAEYFIAWFVVHAIRHDWDADLTSFLFQNVFAKKNITVNISRYAEISVNSQKFKYNVICYFVNSLIGKLDLSLTLGKDSSRVGFAEMNSVAYCSIHNNQESIFRLFESAGAFDNHGEMIFDPKLLLLAVRRSCITLIDRVCYMYEKFQKTKAPSVLLGGRIKTSMLHVAVETREYTIVEHILYNLHFIDLLGKSPGTRELLHYCVYCTKDEEAQLINEKVQIVKMLAQLGRELLYEINDSDATPLVVNFVHIRLLLELIAEGANVFADTDENKTILHTGPEFLSPQSYLKLVCAIPSESLSKLVCVEDMYGYTPARIVLESTSPPDSSTLKRFHAAGVDFNALNLESKNEILSSVVTRKHGVELLTKLIEYGVDLGGRNKNGATLLHIASKEGQLECTRFLLGLGRINVNDEDNQGLTPLNWAVNGRNGKMRHEICMNIVEQGGQLKNQRYDEGHSLLHGNVELFNVSLVRLLVETLKFDVDAKDGHENTPMHQLFLSDYSSDDDEKSIFEIAKILLENGADVNAVNQNKQTVLQLLLDNKHRILTLPLLYLFDKYGGVSTRQIASITLKVVLTKYVQASQNQFQNAVKLLFERGAELDLTQTDDQGNSLLLQAAASGCVNGIRYLVDKGLNIDARNKAMESPLHVVNENPKKEKRMEAVHLLTKLGASLTALDSKQETPIHRAVSRDYLPVVVTLVETGAYDSLLQNGELVCYGIRRGSLGIVKYLCELYATLLGKPLSTIQLESGDKSVLHAGAARGNPEIIHYLLESEDVAESLQHMARMADLLHVCLKDTSHNAWVDKRLRVMESLFAENRQLATSLDEMGRAPLLVENVHHRFLSWLVDSGADISARDYRGDSVTHLASSYLPASDFHEFLSHLATKSLSHQSFKSTGHLKSTVLHRGVENLALNYSTLELLKSHGADFNAVDENQESVFIYAVKGGRNQDFLKLLINFGCSWSTLDTNSASSLHFASAYLNFPAVQLLVSLGSKVNVVDKEQNTPLHYAVGGDGDVERRLSVAQFLIQNGADVNAKNVSNQSPLEYAQSRCSNLDKSIADLMMGLM